MRTCALKMLLVFALAPAWADNATPAAESPPPNPGAPPAAPHKGLAIPDLPSADMRLSWTDFRELLQLLQPEKPEEKDEPAPPPWTWTVSSARYEINATEGPSVAVEATFEFEVWTDDWTTIPILGSGVALRRVQLNGEPAQLRHEAEWFTLLTNQPGVHRLDVQFFARWAESEGDASLQFPAVPAAITEARLLLGADAAAVSSPDAARVAMQDRKGGQEALVALKPAERVQLHWRRPSRVKTPAPPPPPRVTASVATQVRLSPDLLEGTTQVTFDVLRGAVNQFALLLPKPLIVLEVAGKGLEWTLEDQPESQRLVLALNHGTTGAYPVTLRYEQPRAGDNGPVRVPNVEAEDVARQRGILGISAVRNTSLEITEPTRNVSRINPDGAFNLGLDWEVLHAFRYNQPDYALSVAAAVIPPRVVAETELLATLSDTALNARVTTRYEVLRGEVRRLALSVPDDVNVLSVSGPNMDWYAVETDGGQRIEMELNEPLTGVYMVQLELERDIEPGDTPAEIPSVTVHDVARQRGWTGIAAAGNVKVDVGEGITGATRIDESELPAGVRALAESPVLHAFEYQTAPYVLPATVTRLDDVAVRVAAVDRVELDTVVTDEMLITRARYWVRNNQRQFLRIDPGPDVEIWGAQVDGRAVSPAKDPESESGVLLRMRKSREGTSGLGSFPMELIYMQRPPAARFWGRTVGLEAPTTDILADRMDWTVYLPEDHRLSAVAGDLEPASNRAAPANPDRGDARLGQPETIRRLQEGVERFLITDINNPAGSAASQSKSFSNRTYPSADATPASLRIAGVLPVHIDLPQTGVPHHFEQVLVGQGQALNLRLTLRPVYVERGWAVATGLATFLLVLLAVAWRYRGQYGDYATAWRIVIAVLLGIAAIGLFQAPLTGFVALMLGLVAGALPIWLLRHRLLRQPRGTHTETPQ